MVTGSLIAGGNGDREEPRLADFFGSRLSIGEQSSNMHFYRLGGPFLALFDRLAAGKAPRKSGYGHNEVTTLVRLDHDRVRTHSPIIS